MIRTGYTLGPPEGIDSDEISLFDGLGAGDLTSVNTFFQLNMALSFERRLSERTGLGLGYQLMYYTIETPRKTSAVCNEIRLSIYLTL